MLKPININDIINRGTISDELEYQRALIISNKLGLMKDKNPEKFSHKFNLISGILEKYEDYIVSNELDTDDFVMLSKHYEAIALAESSFKNERKILIKSKLKEAHINQSILAEIIGISPTHLSELINGVYPYTKDFCTILSRTLKIDRDKLVFPYIKKDIVERAKLHDIHFNKEEIGLELV